MAYKETIKLGRSISRRLILSILIKLADMQDEVYWLNERGEYVYKQTSKDGDVEVFFSNVSKVRERIIKNLDLSVATSDVFNVYVGNIKNHGFGFTYDDALLNLGCGRYEDEDEGLARFIESLITEWVASKEDVLTFKEKTKHLDLLELVP